MQLKTLERTRSTDSLASSATAASEQDPDSLALTLSADLQDKQVLVSVTPPSKLHRTSAKDAGKRTRAPLDICCVIDVSGSMGTEASIPADPATGAPAESTGLSVLDVVKHALRTIIATMQPDDRLGLVTFSGSANLVAKLTRMTEDGRSKVLTSIESLRPTGSTNLWDGLKLGMDLLIEKSPSSIPEPSAESQKSSSFSLFKADKKGQVHEKLATASSSDAVPSIGRFSTLFILTDGMPNVTPPRGHIPMLKAYLDALDKKYLFSLSTFGFGYSLDTPLLLEIAQVGGGGYGFIPDSGIVGTVFVHAVANAYATYAPRATLDVEVPEGTSVEVRGGLSVSKTSWGVQIAAGDVQFGQSMDIVLRFSDVPNNITATLNYRPSTSHEDCKVHATLSSTVSVPDLAAIRYHAARLEFVEILWSVDKHNLQSSVKALEGLAKKITASPLLANYSDALALAKDVSGEGILALARSNFGRWGKHYICSLARSHQRQQCGNFKDPGLQVYGRDSNLFMEERDKLDAAFMALPPPEPSIQIQQSQYRPSSSHVAGSTSNFAPRKLTSMSRYYCSSGPCFAGDCLVMLSGGRTVRVEELKRGMKIQTLEGANKVAAVVRTVIPSGEMPLCRVGDLKITPWHPIVSPSLDGQWVFPAHIAAPELVACDAVYSVLLFPPAVGNPDAHSISIGSVWCVTLGHGLTNSGGDLRSHNFLGNYEMVLRELSCLEGFHGDDGVVKCFGTRRHPVDGRVCGFVGESQSGRRDFNVLHNTLPALVL